MSEQVWRIIDANLNRVGEGLRILEDIARFILDDSRLSEQLKTMRHELVRGGLELNRQLLQSRDAESDVGINLQVSGENKGRDLIATLVANSRRTQESLRVLEELIKVPDIKLELDSEKFKQARFNLYTIERNLLSKLLRQERIKQISGLYGILEISNLGDYLKRAKNIIKQGARVIELRDKTLSKAELLPIARELKNLCHEQDVFFIINDALDLALAAGADGLRQENDTLPVGIARKLLPIDRLLGCSVTSIEQAVSAQSEGADYLIIGPENLSQMKKEVSLPLVVSGKNKEDIDRLIAAGASSVMLSTKNLG